MDPFHIKILGSYCGRCRRLEHNVRKAVDGLGLNATIEKIEDIDQFLYYKISGIPALVINEKVYIQGKVLSPKQIQEIFNQQF